MIGEIPSTHAQQRPGVRGTSTAHAFWRPGVQRSIHLSQTKPTRGTEELSEEKQLVLGLGRYKNFTHKECRNYTVKITKNRL